MEILKPIKPMLAEYAAGEDVFNDIIRQHTGVTYAEMKYDGYRLQLHKKGDVVKAFTRSMNDVPLEIYPELSSSIHKLPDCVLDCELNGGIGIAGFNAVKNRFRASHPKSMAEYLKKSGMQNKLELRVFDTLNYDGQWLLQAPYCIRRGYTKKFDEQRIKPAQQWTVVSGTSLEQLFIEVTEDKNEGLVCKAGYSFYMPGKRNNEWLKIKKFETLDLVLLGVYMKDDEISQFLCGTYNEERECFETLGKVNAKREGLGKKLYGTIKGKLKKRRPEKVYISQFMKESEMPDFYLEPIDSLLLEVKAMNINHGKNAYSCGLEDNKSYSLRIGWVKGIRDDKKAYNATTTSQVEDLYKKQDA